MESLIIGSLNQAGEKMRKTIASDFHFAVNLYHAFCFYILSPRSLLVLLSVGL